MSSRCSICRHPERASIDVSVLRDGTRLTARQFQVSRPSLDRHKRHLSQIIAADQAQMVATSNDGAIPLLSRLDVMIRHCESLLSQAQANKNFPGAMRAIRELRAYFELKCKLESDELKHRGLPKDFPEQKSRASDGLQRPTLDARDSLRATTLRMRIRWARQELGETAMITEPNNLEYLQEQYAALSARLEQRRLLKQSESLGGIPTCNDRSVT
jgi:aryl-alcohol dehydrogenase-like predicted oxidoreductase